MKNITSLLVLAAFATMTPLIHADTHTWSGAAITANWSTPANWVGDNPPYAGEPAPVVISFPAGAARLNNYCNIADLTVNQFIFSGTGYKISSAAPGTAITLNDAYSTINCLGLNNELAVPLVMNAADLNFIISSGKELHLTGVLSGPGNFKKMSKGDLYLEGPADNTFTGPATVIGGTLHLNKNTGHFALGGPLIIGDTNGPAYAGQAFDSTVLIEADQQIGFSTPVTVNPDGLFDIYGHNVAVGSLTMIGNSTIRDFYGTGTLTLLGNLSSPKFGNGSLSPAITCKLSLGGADRTFNIDSSFILDGVVVSGGGTAGFTMTGFGYLSLLQDNSYSGSTIIAKGTIYANRAQPNSPVVIHATGGFVGYGSIGTVHGQGGEFFPTTYSGANLHSKDVTMDSASTFGVTIQDYQTSPSFLTVTGTVNLGGCKLWAILNTNVAFNPIVGTQFMLIQNDGGDPINGTFAGLPDGGNFKFGGRLWRINYQGGTGNDVVITLLSGQLPFSTDSLVNSKVDGWTYIYGTGTPGENYELQFSTDLKTWIKLQNTNNNNGTLQGQDFHWNQGAPKCFYRFVKPGM